MKKNYFLTFVLILFTNFLTAQESYLGEIRLFAGTYAPANWAFCDGSMIPIRQNTALFSIIGTYYGGDGRTTFALPDLRGRVPVGTGQLPGGSFFSIGDKEGQETITLIVNNMPSHTHTASIAVSNENASTTVPSTSSSIAVSGINSGRAFVTNSSYNTSNADIVLQDITTDPAGASVPVKLSRPKIGLNYIICLQGTFPQRP